MITAFIGYFILVIATVYYLQTHRVTKIVPLVVLGFFSPLILALILVNAFISFFGVSVVMGIIQEKDDV
jgi:hypothetical protein